MIAVIEDTPAGPALLVHGVRVAEKPVGDTTLQALADQINAATGWRPIETAPIEREILVFVPNRWGDGDHYISSDTMTRCGWCIVDDGDPTHWMPMPEPPDAPDVRDHNAAVGWRAIETAPEHIYVLACVARPKMGVAENLPFRAIRNGPRWFVWGGAECFADEYPTHWMDLPEPPDDM